MKNPYFWSISVGRHKEQMAHISGIDEFDDLTSGALKEGLETHKMKILERYKCLGGPYNLIVHSFNRVC